MLLAEYFSLINLCTVSLEIISVMLHEDKTERDLFLLS